MKGVSAVTTGGKLPDAATSFTPSCPLADRMVTPSPLDPPASPPRRPAVELLDLGLARTSAGDGGLTRAGEFLGTPDYVSPEQAQNAAAADIRSDLFSLGGTLFVLLTGVPPLPAGSVMEKPSRLLTDSPASAAGADGTVRAWTSDGREVASFDGFAGPAACVGRAADGASVFAGGADGTLRRWPVAAG